MAASSSLPNPIFRSGEDCRHSNLNNSQDIAKPSAKSWELRATISLTRLLKTEGYREETNTMLADIYNLVHRGLRHRRLDGRPYSTNYRTAGKKFSLLTRAFGTLSRTLVDRECNFKLGHYQTSSIRSGGIEKQDLLR